MVKIEIGSVYEIDHYNLTLNSPLLLNEIRLVKVIEKSANKVTVKFPSLVSLKTHFRFERRARRTSVPTLDEKCVMDLILAEKVLYRKIKGEEWSEHSFSRSFWMLNNTAIDDEEEDPKIEVELKTDNDDEDDEDDEEVKIEIQPKRKIHNRKCKKPPERQQPIQAIVQKEHRQGVNKKQKVEKTFINRWSEDRFEEAENSMLKVLKANGAVAGNPMLRFELRDEARKWIRDTGLLDHMLKHMAGKVAPRGVERFRRRHNPEGNMEYWLESADLVEIRKKAGVQDPYWIPPPGWTNGENPNLGSSFGTEIGEIEAKIAQMQTDMDELKSKKRDERKAIVPKPMLRMINQSAQPNDSSSILAAKDMYLKLVKRNRELGEQVVKLSDSLHEMQRAMADLKSSSVKDVANNDMSECATLSAALSKSGTEKENQSRKTENTTTIAPQRLQKSGFRICRPPGSFVWPPDAASLSSDNTASTITSLSFAHRRPPVKVKLVTVNNVTAGNLFDLNAEPSGFR